jgi:hypothetical protein
MRNVILFSTLVWFAFVLAAQTSSPLVLNWPSGDKPSLKISFGKFVQKGIVDNQGIFTSDVNVQNVSEQGMPRSIFTVFVADSNGVRIGRGRLQIPEISPYRTQTAQLQFSAAGTPASVSLLAGKTIPLRVVSVPAGAKFTVDGEDGGTTPKIVDFTISKHTIEFSKEGYSTGSTELEVGADELPGAASALSSVAYPKTQSSCGTGP